MPVGDVLREYDQFAVSFDTRLRNPRWCVEPAPQTPCGPTTGIQGFGYCLAECNQQYGSITHGQCHTKHGRVLERVTKDSCSGAGNRAGATFEEDEGIDARFRNKLTDFQMSGYDRGHMVGPQTARTLSRVTLVNM